ncbi:MAG: M1 family metallopeptidase [Acidimicrobiia bacterium]|nr:M1 family metallopeptidase [Acidimicrobiia bacterium]
MASEADYRLPKSITPIHYDIRLEPDLDDASFAGQVGIDVDVHEATSSVVLNAIELALTSATVTQGDRVLGGTVSLDDDAERATLTLDGELAPGQARIEITFTGILNDDLRGFYRSVYTNADGEKKVIATTQFEATDARRAFPCWDGPDAKATYTVILIVEEGLMAVSNAAEVGRTTLDDGRIEVRFAKTMKMSTYLVAFIVGDLVATEPVDVDGTPLRIIAPPGNEHLTDFAIDMGAHSLRYFAEYYDIPYPGDKLDMVAIPDFAFGAMENLGCITYRETALLLDPATATQTEMSRVADVIAHEIAHMWFGDLVTMKWWNGIWLNEAFASFAELKAVDAYRPQWKRWLSFSASRAGSQVTDALASTRAIEFEVASPADANAMFDVLTYQKGSSVLRMLEQYLGEESFRTGVTAYLKKHAYSNTDTPDLWAALEEASGEPVGEIMDTWILQGGYPRISVERHDDRFRLTQEQFRLLGEGDKTWQVPVLYSSSAGDGKVVVGSDPVEIDAGEDLIVNAGGEGFFRTTYDGDLLEGVIARLPDLDPIERFAVVSDTYAGVVKGDVAATDFIELVGKLTDEDEVDIWSVALGGVGELDRIISSDDRPSMQSYVRSLVGAKADELGWEPREGDTERRRQMRGLLLRALGTLGADQDTIAMAREVYASGAAGDAEVAEAALMVTASNADVSLFDELIAKSDNAKNPQQKVKYLRAATQIADADAARRLFELCLDGSVRTQDTFWVLALMLGHRENGPLVWDLIEENWDAVLKVIPPVTQRRLIDLVQYRSEPEIAERIQQWFATHELHGGEMGVKQQMELLRAYVGLRERESTRLGASLSD